MNYDAAEKAIFGPRPNGNRGAEDEVVVVTIETDDEKPVRLSKLKNAHGLYWTMGYRP